ncbi:hypothetical protein [Nonomuraea sp. NPDC005692]
MTKPRLRRSQNVWIPQCEREVFFGHHPQAGVPIADAALISIGAEGDDAS